MEVVKPILMAGTGRCGSTFLHRIVARHPDLGWLSPWNEVLPSQAWLSAFSNLYRFDGLGHDLRHKTWFPKPFEAYRYWESFLPGFSRRNRPQVAEDVPVEAIGRVRRSVGRVLAAQGKSRFLGKVTGWSRMAYFDRIFPDARFIVVTRELRSVVSSWVEADWLDTTSFPTSCDWQWGEVPTHYMDVWDDLGGGAILSAAMKIQLDLDDLALNSALFPDRTHNVVYEDLLADPVRELRQLTEFAELEFTPEYEAHVRALPYRDATDKWRRYLSDEEGEKVLEFFDRVAHGRPRLRVAG